MHTTTCLMMVALMCGVTMASPVHSTTYSAIESCAAHAKTLLMTLKNVLNTGKKNGINGLFHGFNCTDLGLEMMSNSQTVAVCQPYEDATCSVQRNPSFNETNCLRSIGQDLRKYRSKLEDYVKTLDQSSVTGLNSISTKLNPIVQSIQNLQKNCLLLPDVAQEHETNTPGPRNTFEDRKSLCKQLKGFHLRAITINRALGYIGAGEYKK